MIYHPLQTAALSLSFLFTRTTWESRVEKPLLLSALSHLKQIKIVFKT